METTVRLLCGAMLLLLLSSIMGRDLTGVAAAAGQLDKARLLRNGFSMYPNQSTLEMGHDESSNRGEEGNRSHTAMNGSSMYYNNNQVLAKETNKGGRQTTALEPSTMPSDFPSMVPSTSPSGTPSDFPSLVPSTVPSDFPSMVPSTVPTATPTSLPTLMSSMPSSTVPSDFPSMVPSTAPTTTPTSLPTVMPSDFPSMIPTAMPSSSAPTKRPTDAPSALPSDFPSMTPTDPTIPLDDISVDAKPRGNNPNSVRYNKQTCSAGYLDPEPEIDPDSMQALIVQYSYTLQVQDGNEPIVTMGLIEDYLTQVLRRFLCVTADPKIVSPDEVAFSASPVDLIYQTCDTNDNEDDNCTLVEGGLTVWLKSPTTNIGAGSSITSIAASVQCDIVQQIESLLESGTLATLPGVYWAQLVSITSCQAGHGDNIYDWQFSYIMATAGAFVILSVGLALRHRHCTTVSLSSCGSIPQHIREGMKQDANLVLSSTVTEDMTMYSRDDSYLRRPKSSRSFSRDNDDYGHRQNSHGGSGGSQCSSCASSSHYSDCTVVDETYDSSYQEAFDDENQDKRNYASKYTHYYYDNNNNNSRKNSTPRNHARDGSSDETIVLDSKLFSLSMKTIPETGSFAGTSQGDNEEEEVWETIALDGH